MAESRTNMVFVKEEIVISDDDDDVLIEDDASMETDEPYVGEGLFSFAGFDDLSEGEEVPGRDPLSMDYEECFAQEENSESVDRPINTLRTHTILEVKTVTVVPAGLKEIENDEYAPLKITSVESLQVKSVTGANTSGKAASFSSLDVFRCFICRRDFETFDQFLVHRTKSKIHVKVPYDADNEKAFSCGICQKPWNQPRKALACAVYGHDPSKLNESMFVHACPLCPENCFAYHSLAAMARHWILQHREKPLPAFLIKSTGNDQLPTIKIGPHEASMVTEYMAKVNPDYVLDNFPVPLPGSSAYLNSKQLKVYRCSQCQKNFETRREAEIHQCSATVPSVSLNKHYVCDDCGRQFSCGRNFRLHLLRAGVCKNDNAEKDFPYKCILCSGRYSTFKSYTSHRSKAHAEVSYVPALELPFACKICEKPAFVPKEAMICALFGHDPSSINKAMFKYKCSQCATFGFHSTFALKRHWEQEHAKEKMPTYLEQVTMDKPLPNVIITLGQLLSLSRLREFGSSLVIEREIHPSQAKFVTVKPCKTSVNISKEPACSIETDERNLALQSAQPKNSRQIESLDLVRQSLIDESLEKGECVVCNKSFKDLRRHFKTHDQSRFSGAPKNKCVCGKEYHLRNSLHSHWKKNKVCKLKYTQMKAGNAVIRGASNAQSETLHTAIIPNKHLLTTEDSALKIHLSTSFQDSNITIEQPETNPGFEPDIHFNSGSKETTKQIDLYSAYAKLDAETPDFDPSILGLDTFDLENFIHLDVEEVPSDCDIIADNSTLSRMDMGIEPKKLSLGTICDKKIPDEAALTNRNDTHPQDAEKLKHANENESTNQKTSRELCRSSEESKLPQRKNYQPCQTNISDQPKLIPSSFTKLANGVYQQISRHHIVQIRKLEKPQKSEKALPGLNNKCDVALDCGSSERRKESEKLAKPILYPSINIRSTNFKQLSQRLLEQRSSSQVFVKKRHIGHNGEKPATCINYESQVQLEKTGSTQSSKRKNYNTYRCCVCGERGFISLTDFLRHRLKSHKDIPYDREKEKAFGCGVCRKPYFLESEAMVCAILGHDPKPLQEIMFQHKCPECPPDRLGFHNLAAVRKHWVKEHQNKKVPMNLFHKDNSDTLQLPNIIINREMAAKIKSSGPSQKYDFPLVAELDPLNTNLKLSTNFPAAPEPAICEEELFLSTVISLQDALNAVKAVAVVVTKDASPISPAQQHAPKKARPKKSVPLKQKEVKVSFRDSLEAGRALGNKRIAKLLERIRTARAKRKYGEEPNETVSKKAKK